MARALLLVLALSTGACASRFPNCPASGGPVWRELVSPHFSLRTDVAGDDARATLRELEEVRAALLHCFRAPPDLDTGRVPVIVVAEGWDEFAQHRYYGFFTRALFAPLVVLRAGNSVARQEAIKHELVHYLSRRVIPTQPMWFAEGLATYFSTIEYDAVAKRITVGRPDADWLRAVRRSWLVGADEMLAATAKPADDVGSFYATAWFMMHYLMNHRANALLAYTHALDRMPARQAWAASFPDLPAAELDRELERYRDGGQYTVLIYPFVAPTVTIAERTLTDADVHATRAFLLALASHDDAATAAGAQAKSNAGRELAEATRQQATHVLANAVARWLLGAPVPVERARAVAAANPDDWMAWALLAEALSDHEIDEGRAAAVEKALELADGNRAVELQAVSSHTPLPAR